MEQLKKLVVYYSLEGNTSFIAQNIAEVMGADLLELQPQQSIKPKGLMKYLWGGKQVVMKEQPDLKPLDKRPEEYDVLIIGTPVWAFSYAAPLNSFFSAVNFKNKKVALFCCHAGGKGKTLANMREALAGNTILGEIDFVEPLRKDKKGSALKAKEWAKGIKQLL